ncbi:MAG TPA: protein kinase [Vicinamibacterales bacterium]|nr:protein kinase [Vicinamibacterales bacterium]
MRIAQGTRLGPYEIVSALGSGGMGDVYSARDTRLDRLVALKTVKSDLAGDLERRARFEREARAIASLTHPHICTLYDVGLAKLPGLDDEVAYLVMELIEGETLADRLARGALPLADALTIAAQVSQALDRAHRQGIVHRDLKPANIMLAGGRAGASPHVKLLDFGLARLRADEAPVVDDATRTSGVTSDGVVMGTLQYMAPEQLEAKGVDQRADIFALGAILYEMVAGRRAFQASSNAGLISAILASEPARLSSVVPLATPALESVVHGCLAKDPDARWASAQDVRLLLAGVDTTAGAEPPPRVRGNRREWLAWAVAALAAVAAAVLALRQPAPSGGTGQRTVLSVLPPEGTLLTNGEAPQISPDGRTVAFVGTDRTGTTRLYVRERSGTEPRALPGTEDATLPFWSPDGSSLGFFANARLKRIGVAGGAAQTLAPAPIPRGGSWNRQDEILFVPSPNQAPHRIPASGGTAIPVPGNLSDERRWFPFFLPDGRHYLYIGTSPSLSPSARFARVGSLDSSEVKDLVQTPANAVYVESGHLVYRREETLVAHRFDAERRELIGTPVRVVDAIGLNPITYQSPFSVSATGVLTYATWKPGWELVWIDRQGRRLGSVGERGGYNTICLTPDGRHVLYDLSDDRTGSVDIWSLDLETDQPSRITSDPAVDFFVTCSPTNPEVVFATLRLGVPQLFRGSLTAPNREQQIMTTTLPVVPTQWSRDGRAIVYSQLSPKTSWDVWMLDLGSGRTTALVQTEADEGSASLSPDGRWIAYSSDRSGRSEVWVQPVPATGAAWQITNDGGRQPIWRPDGGELFFIGSGRKLSSVPVSYSAGTLRAGVARVVSDTALSSWERTSQGHPLAIAPDGERILISQTVPNVEAIMVVLDWLAGRDTP